MGNPAKSLNRLGVAAHQHTGLDVLLETGHAGLLQNKLNLRERPLHEGIRWLNEDDKSKSKGLCPKERGVFDSSHPPFPDTTRPLRWVVLPPANVDLERGSASSSVHNVLFWYINRRTGH